MKKMIHTLILTTSIISLIVNSFPTDRIVSGYELIWIQPITFIFIYVFVLIPVINTKRYRITVYSYVLLAWVRMALIPFLSSISGVYNGIYYILVSNNSIQLAILIVAYELIISSVVLFIIVHRKSRVDFTQGRKDTILQLRGNKLVYAILIISTFLFYIVIGRNLNLIQFFVISTDTIDKFSDITLTSLVLIRQVLKVSLIFFFVWFISYCKRKYDKTGKNRYFYFALLIGVFILSVIVGERRSEQVYTGLVVIFILSKAFKKHQKLIIYSITFVAVTVLLFMSIYKHFSAFYYGSYISALQTSSIDIQWLTRTLQSYFFGTQNVAIAVEFGEVADLNILNLIYDFGRSIFGLSFLLKNRMIMTTEHFNTFIYGFNKANGHVISAVGYGFIYFGAILSPIIVSINLILSTRLEKWFNKTNSYELKYIVGYMLVRFATNIFVNTPPLISLASIMFFTAGLVYFVAKHLVSKKMRSVINRNVPKLFGGV